MYEDNYGEKSVDFYKTGRSSVKSGRKVSLRQSNRNSNSNIEFKDYIAQELNKPENRSYQMNSDRQNMPKKES